LTQKGQHNIVLPWVFGCSVARLFGCSVVGLFSWGWCQQQIMETMDHEPNATNTEFNNCISRCAGSIYASVQGKWMYLNVYMWVLRY